MAHIRYFYLILLTFSFVSLEASENPILGAAGYNHTCATDRAGRLFCWGSNGNGPLGLGEPITRSTPVAVKLPKDRRVTNLFAGYLHTCVLYDNNDLSCWGSNTYGQLGLGTTSSSVGDAFNQTPDKLPPVDLGTDRKIKKVAIGESHVCSLFEDGRVKCWGQNDYGGLGLGDVKKRGQSPLDMGKALPDLDLGNNRVMDIGAGAGFSCALFEDKSVRCWGNYYSIGSGGTSHIGLAPSNMGANLKALNLGMDAKVESLSVGFRHTCALLTSGKVKCWGIANEGSLGVGPVNSAVIGDSTSEMGENLRAVDLGDTPNVIGLAAGDNNTCALFENHAIKCWGHNNVGTLGLGDQRSRGVVTSDMGNNLPFINLGRLAQVTSIAKGSYHNCVVLGTDVLKCWGYNIHSQLGNGSTINLGTTHEQMGDNLKMMTFPTEED